MGDEIGYQVRFDRQCGPRTRILVVTEGLLLRRLQDDPYLENVATVIFDEFHERSLETDLTLAMVQLIQRTVRPELRIVVMSATLAATAVAAYLGDCPIIASQGRLHPVDIVYEPRAAQHAWPLAAALAAEQLLKRTTGDLLVFLPGLREIRQTAGHLELLAREQNLLVLPLHGELAPADQDLALLPQQRRKIVLATNVAETSITVAGITGVVDSGLARVLVFDPRTSLDRLELLPISRAAADQRAGRAGRTEPGVCVRLWSEANHKQRPEQTEPEIRRADLAGPALQLMSWGERDIAQFPWFEAPPPEQVRKALQLLQALAAVDEQGITPLGRVLAGLPVHPRLGCLLIAGKRWQHAPSAALAAAILSERDPFSRSASGPPASRELTASDVFDRVEAVQDFERRRSSPGEPLNREAVHFILRARDQLERLLDDVKTPTDALTSPVTAEEAVLRSLLAAFPDRLARRREPGSRKGVMVGGRGIKLAPSSSVLQPELFLCIDVDDRQTETLVWQASAVERDWLPLDKIKSATVVQFDPDTARVTARQQVRYSDLLLQENQAALPDDGQVAEILLEAARAHWQRLAPTPASPTGELLTRLRCLRLWMPELNLPAFDDVQLMDLLPELCPGCKSFADLQKAPWAACLENRLSSSQRQALEREAPERLLVPSGSRLGLHYELGRARSWRYAFRRYLAGAKLPAWPVVGCQCSFICWHPATGRSK